MIKFIASEEKGQEGILEDLVGFAIKQAPGLSLVTSVAEVGTNLVSQGSHAFTEPVLVKMEMQHKEQM